jgi:YkoY family integral membrane protein
MTMIQNLLHHLPSLHELGTAIPVILSLILIEGLLSVDNAMAIAAMASHLPKDKQKTALKLGIIGAYLFRGICLAFVAFIAGNPWLKGFGALYLIYLMTEHLTKSSEEDIHGGGKAIAARSLLATVVQIEVMDLSLSLDNVVAAVALDKRLWVVCLGVFIGILALRFVAGYCIKLIERFPILKETAFLLVGFVGLILSVELTLEYLGIHYHIDSVQKFVGIVTITAASLWYGESAVGKKILGPLVAVGKVALKVTDTVLSVVFTPITWSFGKAKALCRCVSGGKSATPAV